MATKRDLINEVNMLNDEYCSSGRNKLVVHSSYGGYEVHLTGKKKKNGDYMKHSLGSAHSNVTSGYYSASHTLDDLRSKTRSGELRKRIKFINKASY